MIVRGMICHISSMKQSVVSRVVRLRRMPSAYSSPRFSHNSTARASHTINNAKHTSTIDNTASTILPVSRKPIIKYISAPMVVTVINIAGITVYMRGFLMPTRYAEITINANAATSWLAAPNTG